MTAPSVPPAVAGMPPLGTAGSLQMYRPRRASEIIDLAVQLLRRNYQQFFMITTIMAVPGLILDLVLFRSMGVFNPSMAGDPSAMTAMYARMFSPVSALAILVIMIWSVLMMTVFIRTASDAYLGQTIDIAAAFRAASPRALPMAVSWLLKGIMFVIGSLFIGIGGLFVASWLFAIPAAAVLEPLGPVGALGRASDLSKGLKWHAFVTLFLVYIIYFLMYGVVAVAGYFLSAATHIPLLMLLIIVIVMIAVYPLIPITQVVLYYDARIRKEGFGAATP